MTLPNHKKGDGGITSGVLYRRCKRWLQGGLGLDDLENLMDMFVVLPRADQKLILKEMDLKIMTAGFRRAK